ncbi:MAG TPA: thioesterase family protein [Ignavibacteriaceae bacterium]|nr:thioesterase family protein [Ignavibacteriaceae bacterium]
MDRTDFKHKIIVTVRFNEVDMLGVCNNAVYINYFEHARLQYIKAAGLMPEGGIFSDGRLFFMVRNEINYRGHAHYDDELNIYTRISYIKNSSYGFEHLIENKRDEIIVDGTGVVVHVDPKTRKSTPLPEFFYEKVKAFQGEVKIINE